MLARIDIEAEFGTGFYDYLQSLDPLNYQDMRELFERLGITEMLPSQEQFTQPDL